MQEAPSAAKAALPWTGPLLIAVSFGFVAWTAYHIFYKPYADEEECRKIVNELEQEGSAVQGISSEAMRQYRFNIKLEYLQNCFRPINRRFSNVQ